MGRQWRARDSTQGERQRSSAWEVVVVSVSVSVLVMVMLLGMWDT